MGGNWLDQPGRLEEIILEPVKGWVRKILTSILKSQGKNQKKADNGSDCHALLQNRSRRKRL